MLTKRKPLPLFVLLFCLLLFFKTEAQTNSNPICVQCRLQINKSYGQPKLCLIGVFGHTNIVAYRPLQKQAFEAHLFNEQGKEISKTFFGRGFGLPPKPDKELLDGSWKDSIAAMYGHPRTFRFEFGDGSTREWDFDLVRSFRIKEPGQYNLRVQVRLFTKDTNDVFQPFLLPPVETQVNITDQDFGN